MMALASAIPLAAGPYKPYTLESTFIGIRTDRPGRPFSVISYSQVESQGTSKAVVVKTYRKIGETTAEKVAQRTRREFDAWVSLLIHLRNCDNINEFLGVCFTDPKLIPESLPGIPSIVTAYVKYGSIEYTHGRDFALKLKIVCQLANGLSFMHSLNVVHGDINPDNFRVTEDGVVKIIDLGLSREETFEHTGFTTMILPSYLFIAPELIIPEEDGVSMFVTKASDVYAFSMTALQILDGRGHDSRPFNHRMGPYPVRFAIANKDWPRAELYPGVPPQAWKILSKCWASDPSVRPCIDDLLKDLSGLV